MELTSSSPTILLVVNHSTILLSSQRNYSNGYETVYEQHKSLFWVIGVFYLCLALIGVIGNGLVIYASYGTRNDGPMRHLDDVIKSLAVADALFALIGTPLLIYKYKLGEFYLLCFFKVVSSSVRKKILKLPILPR